MTKEAFLTTCFLLSFFENKITNPGMTITPSMVPISIPPTAAVPILRLPNAPAPLAIIKGIRPAINAKEVINIGRKRATAPSIEAVTISIPCLYFKLAYSTIRIAFLPSKPISMTNATCA
ncbi:hypothetical protein D3C73_488400 [compost metagenome]